MENLDATRADRHEADTERVIVTREQIARRVDELANQITEGYRGKQLTILAVLTGSLMFLSDLMRRIPLMVRLDVMSASSYRGPATKPRQLKLQMPPPADLAGKDVLIVDDILDSGATLEAILQEVRAFNPRSLRTCVLLARNHDHSTARISPDYCGFSIADEFVVGYGLDFNGLYRNLPDICVLKPHVLSNQGETSP